MLVCITASSLSFSQLPVGGLMAFWPFIMNTVEDSNYEYIISAHQPSSPYRRINKGAMDNPYARGNFSQHMSLNQGNNHIVPEYLLTTVPRKDNILIGGMMLATFAASGISGADIGTSGQNAVTLSCMITTVATFAIVQVWHNRRKKAEFRRY